MALLKTQPLRTQPMTYGPDTGQQKAGLRHLLEQLVPQEGVVGSGDYKVTQRGAGANMSVDVAAGSALIRGDTTARQGLYHQVNDGAVNVVIAANGSASPRIDRIYLEIFDSSISGSSDTAVLGVLQGTATAGAQAKNPGAANYMAGATGALGNNRILLAAIEVPGSNPSSITNAMIVDRRPWSRGAYCRIQRNTDEGGANDYTTTVTSAVEIDTTNLKPGVECSGAPLRVSLLGRAANFSGTTPTELMVALMMDGSPVLGAGLTAAHQGLHIPANVGTYGNFFTEIVPPAGRHLFSWAYFNSAGVSAGFYCRTDYPLIMTIEELPRQNVVQ